MEKSRRFALKLLKYLERIFPQDMTTASKRDFNYYGKYYDQSAIQTLIDNGLIAKIIYPITGLPKNVPDKLATYKITPLGIEFLNGLKQKRTNNLLLILTIILTIIGIIQIRILL